MSPGFDLTPISTATAATTILSRVQANPEIGEANEDHVEDLIQRAKALVCRYCHLPRFPSLSQGYSKGGLAPTKNLSGLSTNALYVNVNGIGGYEVNPTLANCTTGALTAAELQTQIRAVDDDGFDEVTVSYDGSIVGSEFYLITSGRYGEDSSIVVTFDEDEKDVVRAMKLSPTFGGTELVGMAYDQDIEDAVVMIVENLYSKIGLEGLQSGAVPHGVSWADAGIDDRVRAILNSRRRIWSS